MQIISNKKKKNHNNRDLIINKNNTNEYFRLTIIKKKFELIIRLIELQEKRNDLNQIYYINESNKVFTGMFKYKEIEHLLIKLDKKNFSKKLNLIKKDNTIKIENIILKEKEEKIIYKDPDKEDFNNPPNFINKKYLCSLDKLGLDFFEQEAIKIFEVFYFNKYFNEPCLIVLKDYLTKISIIRIIDKAVIFTLDLIKIWNQKKENIFGPEKKPIILKHYLIDGIDYFIYAFRNNILIYDLDMNEIKYIIDLNDLSIINDISYINHVLLIKNNDLYYLVISLYNKNKFIIYNFKNGKFINNISIGNNNKSPSNNIIYWKENFIIQLCDGFVGIIDFITSVYEQFNNGLNNKNGIYNKEKNIFIIFAEENNDNYFNYNNYINFYDLDKKLLLRKIEIENKFNIINLVQWNKNIVIINLNRKCLTIDVSKMQIINNYYDYGSWIFMKKIKFIEYGESIISFTNKKLYNF